jgi:hypothetical protein
VVNTVIQYSAWRESGAKEAQATARASASSPECHEPPTSNSAGESDKVYTVRIEPHPDQEKTAVDFSEENVPIINALRSKKGRLLTVFGVAALVLDQWGRATAAKEIYRAIREHSPKFSTIAPWISPLLFALGLFFFAWDNRKNKPHDMNTLKGRTLQLRDDMKAMLDSLPPLDPVKMVVEEQRQAYIVKRLGEVTNRVDKLVYGYELRFADRGRRIYNEFAEQGIHDSELDNVIGEHKTQERYKIMIASLSRLADKLGIADSV